MPNPDGSSPVGPNARAATVMSALLDPASLPSQVEMPNPDGSGPVGPNVDVAKKVR
jgi:hypothetical protein